MFLSAIAHSRELIAASGAERHREQPLSPLHCRRSLAAGRHWTVGTLNLRDGRRYVCQRTEGARIEEVAL
jgi:hypothetical protein